VCGFDLLPYPEHLDHRKVNGELPYPLPKRHFRPDLAVRTYRDHLDAWVRMEELGLDGIGFLRHTLRELTAMRTRIERLGIQQGCDASREDGHAGLLRGVHSRPCWSVVAFEFPIRSKRHVCP
jgi:hypothetical protein